MNKFTSRGNVRKLILAEMDKLPPSTINEVINSLWRKAIETKNKKELVDIGWRFFTHCNKHFAPLERAGLIENTGKTKLGELNRMEKVWRIK